jgi:2-dehydro-3-deoxyphosphooctonate aldolase (KDO 8-P synthase)
MNNYRNNWDGTIAPGVTLDPSRLTLLAGPCMLESLELGLQTGLFLRDLCRELSIQYVFKASFDKANRTSRGGVRGPGETQGLKWLAEIKERLGVPVLTDIHAPEQASAIASVCDILQVPAFLSSHRELLRATALTGKTVQIKKAQHATAQEAIAAGCFVDACGNRRVILCDRGTSFGYHNLVVDFRNLVDMAAAGFAVAFDATHAAQLPGAGNGQSSGLRHVVPALARAGVAVGVSALFLEVHPNPDAALSDKATQLDFATAERVIRECVALSGVLRNLSSK